jgi:hypothetical protein
VKPSNLIVIGTALAVACGSSGPMPDAVPSGAWGGRHLALEVTESGATVELDCAHGTIGSALRLDAEGRLSVEGVYVQDHGGPDREAEPEDAHPAVYSGRLDDDKLTITITLTDDGTTIGPFTVVRNAAARLYKCK